MVKDPVCGMEVEEEKAAVKTEYQGKVYYFCSKRCLERFNEEPEIYVSGDEKGL